MQSAIASIAPDDLIGSLTRLDQAVLDALPIGVYVCDHEGRIVRVNHIAEQLWGRKAASFDTVQRFCGCFRVESIAGVPLAADATPMAQAVRHGASFRNVEAKVENPDGRRWIASVTVQPLYDVYGQIAGAINCFQDITREFEQREALKRQQKCFDLAMVASKMGTWRYTMADNICRYDENAQRLYGLTEEHFLHDEEGVKNKFHADDLELMWSRVMKACDAAGDGLYDVQYRVKQLDGSWRWLSAWGYVEFEGEGEARKPVAIAGASRDMTDLVNADEAQKLLVNELNHRVKNMLATVQSVAMQTQRYTPESFAERFEARLMALSRAHDLLTRKQWARIGISELLEQAFSPFSGGTISPFRISGPDRMLSPRVALALGMVLHELATNATKYGALSMPSGAVDIDWTVEKKDGDDWIVLNWIESGGPPTAQPSRRGFGSRLIERTIGTDLGGEADLRFLASGARCLLRFPLIVEDAH